MSSAKKVLKRRATNQAYQPGEEISSGSSYRTNAVDHPAHYGGKDSTYEVIKVLENWLTHEEFVGALKFNIIKYQARARLKAGAQDYEKAAWYANYLAEFLKRTSKQEI